VNIYPAGRVRGSYYLYPTRPVDIPRLEYEFCVVRGLKMKDGGFRVKSFVSDLIDVID